MAMSVNHIPDTIVCDTTRLQQFISSGNYDYNSELNATEHSSLLGKMLDNLVNWLEKFVNSIFSGVDHAMTSSKVLIYVCIAVIVILLLVLLYVMYKRKMFFFRRRKKIDHDYEVLEDNIYGIEFEQEIESALTSGNYKEAIRIRYLQCLRTLSDNNAIVWMAFKTPLQYTLEFVNDQFKELTSRYVLVRYGDYDASQPLFDKITQLYNDVVVSLTESKPFVTPATTEGGEQ